MPRGHLVRHSAIVRTPRVAQLEGFFDIPPTAQAALRWDVSIPCETRPWAIGLIVGPSGSGKSTIARELFGAHVRSGFAWPADRALVDGFPKGLSIKEITALLSSVGLSSPPAWLRPFGVLSTGEQFRVTLARALAEAGRGPVNVMLVSSFGERGERCILISTSLSGVVNEPEPQLSTCGSWCLRG